MNETVLELQKVSKNYPYGVNWRGKPTGQVHALNQVDLTIKRGETLGIVGESGCGKTTLAQLLLGIVKPSSGQLIMQNQHSTNMQIVFQDPQSSLNARMPVWRVITEPLFAKQNMSKTQLRDIAHDLIAKVGLRAEVLDRYPHEFSGGQRQRIAIARALSSNPDIIILDEPTSALDISVQAQILNLLQDIQQEQGLSYLFISHNISVIEHMCDRIAVMYLGQVVEIGDADDVLKHPAHPYTELLLDSVPSLLKKSNLTDPIENTELPSNRNLPKGCFFRDRCILQQRGCEKPQTLDPTHDSFAHQVRCIVRAQACQ